MAKKIFSMSVNVISFILFIFGVAFVLSLMGSSHSVNAYDVFIKFVVLSLLLIFGAIFGLFVFWLKKKLKKPSTTVVQ